MSSPSPYADGGNDVSDPRTPPNVYLPQSTPPPAYDAYADPAAAHGWQNAYDETRELPLVGVGEPDAADGDAVGPAGVGGGVARPGGEAAGRRGRRRAAPLPRTRRAAVAGSAVGAVSVAALIAAFAFSGSPSDGGEGKADREDVTTGRSEEPSTVADPSVPAGGPDVTGSPSAGSASPSASGSGDDRKDGTGEGDEPSSGPSATASITSTPTLPTASPTASTGPGDPGPGNSGDRPGRGQGPKRSG
ncbi:hypothetical protein AB0L56_02315 [Streptomyces sp. NPDC052079]|uniref:hypothetical protein n=1 Tax=Streptomyces sp. NPDC052079 TaxID=3155526 RepID=UPI0034431C03